MRSELLALLPQDKCDVKSAEAIVALGYPAVEPILIEVLEWLQDINWPVARVFLPMLVDIGESLTPYVKQVLYTDDDVWKYYVIQHVVAQSPDLAKRLLPELQRISKNPSPSEHREEVSLVALEALEQFHTRGT